MGTLEKMAEEMTEELTQHIAPFWMQLQDRKYGGYYGYLDYQLKLNKKAEKGCILNSRIIWFFSNAYTLWKNPSYLAAANHGYEFLVRHCLDQDNGGIYWSLNYDGTVADATKHTYNQAFCIYALSSYYEASGKMQALQQAMDLFHLIENKCKDEYGYLEAFTRNFEPQSNEKLSENGVLADKTMNTLLHVLEAYTELYRVSGNQEVKECLFSILNLFIEKIFNPEKNRQEVFFDKTYHSILDLHSYGHDIETSWLIDRAAEILDEPDYSRKISQISKALTAEIYRTAFDGHSLSNECDRGKTDTNRVWWVQAETVVGFVNGYQKAPEHPEYLQAAESTWRFICQYVIDHRQGSEWYWLVQEDGTPVQDRPIVEPWKCPYHNGRMCMEIIKRAKAEKEKAEK